MADEDVAGPVSLEVRSRIRQKKSSREPPSSQFSETYRQTINGNQRHAGAADSYLDRRDWKLVLNHG
jgi:hypothetical protein